MVIFNFQFSIFNYPMAYYKLIRKAPDGKWVRGTLCQVQHRFSRSQGKQIEYLTPICPTLENLDKQIPALIYRIQVTKSPRFKRLLPLVCQVPGRAGIRIHRGTRPEHSAGCILVPPAQEQLLTARLLAEQQAHEEIRLEIINPK
jgi:hypothetical protein